MRQRFAVNTLYFSLPDIIGADPESAPWTMFQYREETTGIWAYSRYLFIWSMVAVVPALLADTTTAPGFRNNPHL